MTEEDRHRLSVFLSQNPDAGDLIQGTGGARKLRIPLKGKGKSGGARVVTYFAGDDVPVFLLDVYSKGDKINLTKAERNEMRVILADLAEAYRDGVKVKTKRIGDAS
ncbi:type II toxin-antitoxin system RelE/ParE family toxin [Paracoccus sp. SCSIO 75233]|uniref:type II toxin-antitoxin system RelE/ParE family toxin n=1 Tax=Paracoccus sp. SCSIO 75233 TaxID=3017782 RepID=UPI0022F044DF|nr:type II toxin-antitoxin system RelE/ParE family toxin [Paracoccus sp. SCSIO 75233]WBU53331.1 type II toxin-antitoxin system RelE/ParE family toxin [Paracoccus sp. SCSIO 75233]